MDEIHHQNRQALWLGVALLALAGGLLVAGAGIGSTGLASVWAARDDPVAWQIVWDIRLPRTLGAGLAGALLGLAGAVAQGLFRNPLAAFGPATTAPIGTPEPNPLASGITSGLMPAH